MTQDELIERLGGARVVAAALGLAPNVVGNWKSRGIATWALGRVARLCQEQGVDPGDSLEGKPPRQIRAAS